MSREIAVSNGLALWKCVIWKKNQLEEGPFLKEAKNLINAVAENIAKIIEREEAEAADKKTPGPY